MDEFTFIHLFYTSNEKGRCLVSNLIKKNRAGFSLLEIILAIAVVSVLAMVALNSFFGTLQNSRKASDEQQAKTIESAIRLLITESATPDIITNYNKFKKAPLQNASPAFSRRGDHQGVMDLISALQAPIYAQNKATGKWQTFGPYLKNPRDDGTTLYASYSPVWNPSVGGKHVGYSIRIWPKTQTVIVEMALAESKQEMSEAFDPNQGDFIWSRILTNM
jgi:prepilin-type N-terminal cleavage/methylation domain-containing protein